MSGLAGCIDTASAPGGSTQTAALTVHARERRRSIAFERGGLEISALDGRAQIGSGDGVHVALFGTARWRDRGHADAPPAPQADLAARIGREFLARGPQILDHLDGHFALAVVVARPDRREALIATDRLGIEPVCYASAGNGIVFSSRADVVARHAGVGNELDPQAIYDYLYFHVVPAPRTIFRRVSRLLPGEYLRWKDGRAKVTQYWKPRFVEDERADAADLKRAFVSVLERSVARALDGGDATGCFLSGGTDSSTVCGMAGRVSGRPAQSFSIGFDAQGYDEMSYARVAARHFGAEHHEYYVTPEDVVAAMPRIAAAFDQPFGNASVVPAYCCARFAQESGVNALLAGDGGDELYGGNDRYAKQHVLSLYGRLPAALRRAMLDPLAGALPAVGVLRKAQGYVRQANVPLPDRLQTYNLLERLGAAQVLAPDFLERVDTEEPARLLRESYSGAEARSQINRLLALDLRFTIADSDIPKVNRACELAGVGVHYPLLDAEDVDFSLHLAPEQKLRGTQLRYFFKQALGDFLPREVIEKKKHGFGLPFGPWLRTHAGLQALSHDTLARLRGRGIVRDDLIAPLMGEKLDEHAGYYGTLVWILMMLELWLARGR